ncbi:uncharacterized protein [Lolium perenne]|uniref:uncharacterized protein n=1 Tax=Lolium perenne TaxID=4522 RepID=UPI003A99F260
MTQGSISALIAKQWKNWSNGKQREKVNNTVLFYQATHDKLIAEFPKYKLITPFVLSKRFWVQSNIGVQATDSSGVDAMLGFPTGFIASFPLAAKWIPVLGCVENSCGNGNGVHPCDVVLLAGAKLMFICTVLGYIKKWIPVLGCVEISCGSGNGNGFHPCDVVLLAGGEPYMCHAAVAAPTLMQQLFIGNKQDTPLRAFDLGFSMHVVTRSSIQVNKEDEFSTGLCLCSC